MPEAKENDRVQELMRSACRYPEFAEGLLRAADYQERERQRELTRRTPVAPPGRLQRLVRWLRGIWIAVLWPWRQGR